LTESKPSSTDKSATPEELRGRNADELSDAEVLDYAASVIELFAQMMARGGVMRLEPDDGWTVFEVYQKDTRIAERLRGMIDDESG
jgi:hypothetical protein